MSGIGSVINLEKVGDLRDPPLLDEALVEGMLIVSLVASLILEVDRKAEVIVVLLADLTEAFKAAHAGKLGQHQGGLEKGLLFRGTGRMLEGENNSMTDHAGVEKP